MGSRFRLARKAEILLVEDNEDHVMLTREGFRRTQLPVNLHHVENGEECMAFLRHTGRYRNAPRPDIVLLDLNMPVMGGREVLEQIVADPDLSELPIVVLTTSWGEQDILHMYRLRCNTYIVKPVDFEEFMNVIRIFNDYWFSAAALPSVIPTPDREAAR